MEGAANEHGSVGPAVFGYFLVAVWIVELLIYKRVNFSYFHTPYAAFVFWSVLSFFWTNYQDVAANNIVSLISSFIFYIIVYDVAENRYLIIWMLRSYFVGVFFLALTALTNIQQRIGYAELSNRFSADGTDPNNFGMMLALSIALLGVIFIGVKKSVSLVVSFLVILLYSYLIISSASRASVFVMLFIIIFLIYLYVGFRKFFLMSPIFLMIGLWFLFIFSQWIPDVSTERILNGFDEIHSDDRFAIWKNIYDIDVISLFGSGTGATYAVLGIQAHNTFFSSLMEVGLIGLIIWLAFWMVHFFAIIVSVRNDPSKISSLLLLSFFVMLVASVTLNWEFRKQIFLMMAIFSRYMCIVSYSAKK